MLYFAISASLRCCGFGPGQASAHGFHVRVGLATETAFAAHVRLPKPFVIKADGRGSRCVMFISRNYSGR
jgi:hypothetical protein